MKKFNWKKIVAPIAMLVIGLLGGLLGAFILLTAAGVSLPIQQIQVLKQLRPYTTIQQIQLRPLRKYKMPLFLSSITKKGHHQIL